MLDPTTLSPAGLSYLESLRKRTGEEFPKRYGNKINPKANSIHYHKVFDPINDAKLFKTEFLNASGAIDPDNFRLVYDSVDYHQTNKLGIKRAFGGKLPTPPVQFINVVSFADIPNATGGSVIGGGTLISQKPTTTFFTETGSS
jgi:hypothetical protein